MTPWEDLRRQFPVTRNLVYLNHAAVSPLPLTCKERMDRYLDELVHRGAARYPDFSTEIKTAGRRLGARLLGTEPDRIFFVRSTTQGLGIAATGLSMKEGDNVVLAEKEFPANIRPWLPLRGRGVEIRMVPQRQGRVMTEDLARAVDDRTAVVSLSFVQFLSGFRLDLGSVAEICRKHDALFVVDAIQGAGVFELDVEVQGIDLLSADSHKWLMGPEGVGLGYCSPRALERIQPALEGWLSVVRPFDFFDLEQPLKPNAARFEEGAHNHAGIHGMVGSLELILSVGVEALSRRILELTDHLADSLLSRGWSVLSPRERDEEKSGIVLCYRRGVDLDELSRRLAQQGIIVTVRGDALRISPHGYNTSDELEMLVEALGEC